MYWNLDSYFLFYFFEKCQIIFQKIALEANCTICTTECWGTIWDSSIIGDGVCSDDLNTPFCDYDGGDCCLPYIVKSCLYNCICHEDGLVHPTFKGIVQKSLG